MEADSILVSIYTSLDEVFDLQNTCMLTNLFILEMTEGSLVIDKLFLNHNMSWIKTVSCPT